MSFEYLLRMIEKADTSADRRLSLSYNNSVEEALKLAIKVRNSDGPVIAVKENAYHAGRLRDMIEPFFNEGEVVSYLPEES